MSATPSILIAVVAYHSEEWLHGCLRSLSSADADVALLDNGGMTPSAETKLSDSFPRVRFIPYIRNLGFALGNNHVLSQGLTANVRLVGLVNPDAWLESGWCEAMREEFARHPEFGILSPLQLTYDQGTELAEWTRKTLNIENINQLSDSASPIEVSWVEGSALFIRREIVDQLGLFDPVFDMYFEEVDLCRRVRRAGWKVGIVPTIRYHHAVGTSLGGKESPTRQLRKDLGQLLYIATDPGCGRVRNVIEVVRMLARRAALWVRGGYPLFPQFLLQGAMELFRKRRLIAEKWHRERNLRPHRGSP